MDPFLSLDYYQRIFDVQSPAFDELLGALIRELEDYRTCLTSVLDAGEAAFARLRHDHRPLVENLRLQAVRSLEIEIADALKTQASPTELGIRLAAELQSAIETLTSARSPDAPGPR